YLTRRIANGDSDHFTYDHENRLVQMARTGSALALGEYAYDGDGRRVKSVQDGATTYYVNDLVEYRNGVLTTTYYADGARIAQRVGSGAPTYFLLDHLGSTRYTLDNSATKTSEMRYAAWGGTRFQWSNDETRRQYTGQISDTETGLCFYNARYYDPALHRFTQADTIVPDPQNPQSLNRYSYV